MNYVVLARKWRPMTFEDVVGQAHITRTLVNALKNERVAHAYIFAGPRGVGKTTTARLLAKAVNCQNQPALDPCNNCDNCQSVTDGRSLDVIEIDGASNRGIDEIRNLRENIRFAPASSRFKVYIIDEVHMLSKDAFNALLKTLEEPPSHAIFIFATTEIHRVPLTILSRCQRFDFKRIPTSTIVEHLSRIAKDENIKVSEECLLLVARKAEGGMRDATSILDQLISSSGNELSIEQVQETLGVIGDDLFFKFTDLMPQKKDGEIILYVRSLFEQGHDVMNFIAGLQEHFRNLMVTRATGTSAALETSDHYKSLYEQQAPNWDQRDLLHYLDLIIQNEEMLKFSENQQLVLELLLLKLMHKPATVDLESLLDLLKQQHAGGDVSSGGGSAQTGKPRQTQSAAASAPPAQKTTSTTESSSQFNLTPAPEPKVAKPEAPSAIPPAPSGNFDMLKNLPPLPSSAPPAEKASPPSANESSAAPLATAAQPLEQPEAPPMVPPAPMEPAAKPTAPPIIDSAPKTITPPVIGNTAPVMELHTPPPVAEQTPQEVPGPDTADKSPESSGALTVEVLVERWTEVVAAVKKRKIALASFLQDGVPHTLDKGILKVAFDEKTGFHMAQVEKNAGIIEAVFQDIFNTPLRIECMKLNFSEAGIKKQIKTPEEAFESMKDKEPVLKKIIDLFDCENLDDD